jgi:hypothetical protein
VRFTIVVLGLVIELVEVHLIFVIRLEVAKFTFQCFMEVNHLQSYVRQHFENLTSSSDTVSQLYQQSGLSASS